jgi:hypothetical protein
MVCSTSPTFGAPIPRVESAGCGLDNRSVLFRVYRDRLEGLKEVFRKPFLGVFGLLKPGLRRDVVEDAFESVKFVGLELPLGEISLHGLLPRPMTGGNFLSISVIYKGLSTATATVSRRRQ